MSPSTQEVADKLLPRHSVEVIHENNANTPAFNTLREKLATASKIMFLGFGFHASNMTKIGPIPNPPSRGEGGPIIAATHKGIRADPWGRLCMEHFGQTALSRNTNSELIRDLL